MKALFLGLFILASASALVRAQSATVIAENANLRGTPSAIGKIVDRVPENTTMDVIKQRGAWFLVQTTEYVGWIHGDTIKLNGPLTESVTPRTIYQSVVPTPTVRQSSESRQYFRGSRSGCYYLSSKGTKVYVDHALCN